MSRSENVIAGINPRTRICVVVGIDDEGTWQLIRDEGYVAVPATRETARRLWGELVPDVYLVAALAEQTGGQQ